MAINQVDNDLFVQGDHARKTYSGTRDTSVTETLSVKGAKPQTRARADLEPAAVTADAKADRFFQNDGIRSPRAPAPRAGAAKPTPSGRPVPELDEQLKLLSSFGAVPALAYLNIKSIDDAMAVRLENVPDAVPLTLAQPQFQIALDNSFDNTTAATHGATGGDARYSGVAQNVMNAGGQGRVSAEETSALGSQIRDHSSQVKQTQEQVVVMQAVLGDAIEARRSAQRPAQPQPAQKTVFQRSMETPREPARK